MAGAVKDVGAGKCHKERREGEGMPVGVGLARGEVPVDLLFTGSCNHAARVVANKTQSKRCVRDI